MWNVKPGYQEEEPNNKNQTDRWFVSYNDKQNSDPAVCSCHLEADY